MKSTASEPGLNLLFHWSPLICTSILFRDRGIVMSQSLLFSQPVTNNLSNRCRSPQQDKGFDCYLGKRDSAKFGQEMWIRKDNDFWDSDDKSSRNVGFSGERSGNAGSKAPRGGGVLPYITYTGMCRPKGL